MENNVAFQATLTNIKPIEGADKIVTAQVTLNGVPVTQVIVGKDTQEGTKVVYFDANLALSDEFLKDNPEMKTYLAKENRIRCVKLKSQISNGIAVPVERFARYTDKLPESFTELGGVHICHKWFLTVQEVSRSNKVGKAKKAKKPSRVIPELFHFHIDTAQLARNIQKINPTDVISISRKVHGQSGICSRTQVKKTLSVWEKLLKVLHLPVVETKWDYLFASRTVIKNSTEDAVTVDQWSRAGTENFVGKLHKGETVYYEIVGYLPETSTYIQKGYDYGCHVGQYKVLVYRITQTNEDGVVFEHGWASMKERCAELGVPMVEQFYFGKANSLFLFACNQDNIEQWRVAFLQGLRETFLEKPCWDNLTKKVPDEGVVLRVEAKDITVFKLKSEAFYLQESTDKDNGDVGDDV